MVKLKFPGTEKEVQRETGKRESTFVQATPAPPNAPKQESIKQTKPQTRHWGNRQKTHTAAEPQINNPK